MDINLASLAKNTIVLHGLSGAGKSVALDSIKDQLGKRGINEENIYYFSSGDLFRSIQQTNPDIAQGMKEGKYLPTLDPIMPIVQPKLTEAFIKQAHGEKVVFIFDGFMRRGEFEHQGNNIPPQIEQVSAAYINALRQARKSSRVREVMDPTLATLIKTNGSVELDTPYIHVTSGIETVTEMMRRAHHVYVDVRPEDAEALMRFRWEIANTKLANLLRKENTEDSHHLAVLVDNASKVQAGRVSAVGGNSRTSSGYSLKPLPDELHEAVDAGLDEVRTTMIRDFRLDSEIYCKKTLTETTEAVLNKLGIDAPTGRKDDERMKSRQKRIGEFRTTENEVLIAELGFSKADGQLLPPSNESRIKMIVNGPGREITYELLTRELGVVLASGVADEVTLDHDRRHIVGESYLHRGAERA